MPNDNTQSNQDTNPLIDNKTIIFTSLSGYLAFSGNLVVEITDKVLQHKIKYLSLAVDVHNGVVSGMVKSTSTNDPMRIAATIGMEVVGEKAGAAIGKTLAKVGFNVLTRIATGAATGAVVGSSFPIVGTIAGAVVGAVVTGLFSDLAYDYLSGEKAKQETQEQKEKELEEIYVRKIQRINAYTMQNRLIQTRYFTEEESKILNEYLTNPYISYFKVILFYLSCPNLVDVYVDEDINIKELQIKPIADAISITLEIEKCYDESNMNKAHTDKLLINKTIYVYNNRFKRVVAKAQTDENGKAVFTEVFVGKEHTIDELRFMVDRDNFTESGFNASVLKYAPMFNVQKTHKQAKQANIAIMKFCFTDIQYAMKDNEVLSLVAHKNLNNVFLDYKVKKSDEILKQYVNFAYRVFDMQDVGIEEYIKNINIENRVKSKLVYCGNGINNNLKVKEEWREKIVAFFAFFNSQINTPYYKLSFINKPIVILDLGNSGAIPTKYEQNSLKRVDIIYDIIQIIESRLKNIVTLIKLQENSNETMNLDERIKKANIIKQNTQSEKILFLSLHIDSEESGKVSGMRCFYNDAAYAEQEKRFIECLKKVYPVANNIYFENKSNLYLTKLTNMASVLVTLGFISNNDDKARLNNKNQRQIIANKLFLAISNYIHGIK